MEDKEIVNKILNGDPDSFEKLFDKYYSEALRAAYLITGNKCDSEYVVQDTFIKSYEKLSSLKRPENFKYWFFRILTRTAWSYCKKQKKEQPVSEIFDKQSASHDKSSFQILAEQETSEEISRAIQKLDNKQKTVVILYYYNEFSVKEIAEIMRCSAGTVKSRLFFARKNLSKALSTQDERSFKNA
jgi:RNA polymerase sigma factor (sigma-70 family)